MLVDKDLPPEEFVIKILGWKHLSFNSDNSVRILARYAQTNFAEYSSRPPISLNYTRMVYGGLLVV